MRMSPINFKTANMFGLLLLGRADCGVADSRRCHHSAMAFCRGLLRASRMRYAVRDEPCMTRLTTMAAMPASTAFACGDASMSMIGFDGCACS